MLLFSFIYKYIEYIEIKIATTIIIPNNIKDTIEFKNAEIINAKPIITKKYPAGLFIFSKKSFLT